MDIIAQLRDIVGAAHVLTGPDTAPYCDDWTGKYQSDPLAVVRPADTAGVSAVLKLANDTGTPIVPASGRTGLNGGAYADGAAVMLSLERLNTIREIRPAARVAIVGAGVILSQLHEAVEQHDLVFPLTFGAKGSAMIGGALSTNAGGSNVLRYGSTRHLCLGLEVVLADGRMMDLMSELHKDNSGYDLKDLMIGAEGTLGIITAAVLKLAPKPRAYATAMVAAPDLPGALSLLNRLQIATGGAVEAFEFMPRRYIEANLARFPDGREPFEAPHEVNVMVEVGALAPRDATPGEIGSVPIVDYLEEVLAEAMEDGAVLDAVVARNEAQRRAMWQRREQAAEVNMDGRPLIQNDVALPLDHVAPFLDRAAAMLAEADPGANSMYVAHLGDGNVHYTVYPAATDPAAHDAITERVEDLVLSLGGSFSAEHGIGLSKKPSMARRKNPVALEVMRAIKAALDPKGILNPGKVLPD
ncbi:FAD-binding oxidoreductase [Psychromarinibacter sp. C21-152]|uniref:FAD-binding oxidoreductase n=1 Tax=Psychromarinibacter sediminicola TaxID=3033385 RepID=A0AAE3NPD9_9RHOB|nr:FAD-binding oxidoreductase [Psychromarinibacter sediminicola]MDF0601078.1 FAD-binding oxidoreductase [Psychromarinibacter sediminicola]